MSATVRRAVLGDAGAMAALHGRCFTQGWTADWFAEILAAEPARDSHKAAFVFPGPTPGALAGMILAEWVSGLTSAEIWTICTAPDARRAGVGGRLVGALLDDLVGHGIETVSLEVAVSNIAAISLYTRWGFVEVGRRKGYYPAGNGREDALILSCRIGQSAPY